MPIRIFSSALLCACTAVAGEVRVSVNDIPRRVQAHNPEINAARFRIDEAKGRLLGSGRPSNPEAGVSFTHDSKFREGTIGISLDQKFPVTSRLRLEKTLSRQLVTSAELEVRNGQRKVIEEAQLLAVKLKAVELQRKLRIEQTALAEKLSTFAADRAAKGEISPLDAAQIQVDSQRLLLDGRKLDMESRSLLGKLKPLLGIGAADTLSLTGDLPPVKLPGKTGWSARPDYQLSKSGEVAAFTEIDLAKARKWQDLNAGLMWEGERMEDAPDGLQRTGFVGFRLSIPLPIWNKNEGEIAEKTAGAARATLETKALAKTIENEAAAAREMMEANASLASETREKILPLVLEQTEKLEKAYETGQADLLTVLRAREQRIQLEVAALDATRDFHLARVRYEAAVARHAPASSGGK